MARRKEGKYWDDIEDSLMRQYFSTGSTEIQKTTAINTVMPKLKMMARIILERYYNRYNDDDLQYDAIMHVLQYSKYDENKAKTFYAYLGTGMKNFFHTILVVKKEYKTLDIDTNYDVGDDEWIMNNNSEQPNFEYFDTVERQFILEKIIKIIDVGIHETDSRARKLRLRRNRIPLTAIEMLEREILILFASKEYFNKYFLCSEISSASLADYCRTNLENIPLHVQQNILRKYFGMSTVIERWDNRDSKNEKRYKDEGKSYLMDDFTPNNEISEKIRKAHNHRLTGKHTTGYEYF